MRNVSFVRAFAMVADGDDMMAIFPPDGGFDRGSP
jgi:hypothetical protein